MKSIVLEKTPNSITKEIIDASLIVVENTKPFFVDKKEFAENQINKCTFNVKKYISQFGGEIILGWEIVVWEKVLAHFIGHSIVKKENEYFCVTPSKYNNSKILFVEDPHLTFDFDNVNSRMPIKLIPLNSSKMVRDFIEIENKIYKIKIKFPVSSGNILLQGDEAIYFKKLQSEKEFLVSRIRAFYK